MNDPSYFHWDIFRQPMQTPSFAMGASLLDIREDAMRGLPGKTKGFHMEPSCALWSKEVGLDTGDGMTGMGGRILEIRKEKSRDAARSRRGKENYEFYELAKLLPLPAAITSQLDKASIIRLSISYLRLRHFSVQGDPPWSRDGPPPNKTIKGAQRRRSSAAVAMELFELHQGAHILQSLDGFAFSLSNDGRFLYISETVSIYLGLSQVEMAGSSIFEYVHHQDHQELADQLGLGLGSVSSTLSSPSSPGSDTPTTPRAITPPVSDRVPVMTPSLEKGMERLFCIRMKSTLTKRGVHVRSSGYRVVQIIGRFRHEMSFGLNRKMTSPLLGMVGMAIALPPPTITELRIEADTFIMRLSPEFKVIYCENLISTLTDWKAEDLTGMDLYTFCHAGDLSVLRKMHIDLLSKGQVLSPSIRLMNKTGGYILVEICATCLYNSKGTDDQTILAIYHVLSGVVQRGCVMDVGQVSGTDHSDPRHTRQQSETPVQEDNQGNGQPEVDLQEHSNKACSAAECGDSELPSANYSRICSSTKTAPTTSSGCAGSVKQCSDPSKIYQPSHETDVVLQEEDKTDISKFENKLSRRKTDRPRKRRRDSGDELFFSHDSDTNNIGLCLDNDSLDESRLCKTSADVSGGFKHYSSHTNGSQSLSLPDSPDQQSVINLTSPQVPEDLSVRSVSDRKESSASKQLNKEAVHSASTKMVSSSVMELEQAMNRHLPASSKSIHSSVVSSEDLSDLHKQKSTIQWIGSHQPAISDSLSASAFLRHLYANRESVIRSNGRPQFFNGDIPSLNMLTPPGSEGYKEHLHLNIPQISVLNKGQAAYSTASVAMTNSTTESYSMTPPSSVSPQEKVQSPFHDNQLPDCSGMVTGSESSALEAAGKHHSFPAILNSSTSTEYDTNKSQYPSLPSYPGAVDFHTFPHNNNSVQNSIISYDSRLSNTGTWYGSAYSS